MSFTQTENISDYIRVRYIKNNFIKTGIALRSQIESDATSINIDCIPVSNGVIGAEKAKKTDLSIIDERPVLTDEEQKHLDRFLPKTK